jgi:hypothetical protein
MPNAAQRKTDPETCGVRSRTNGFLGRAEVVIGIVARGQTTEEDEDCDHHQAKDENLPHGRAGGAKLGPGAASLEQVLLYLLLTELEPEHSKEGDAVAEHLEVGDHGTPDENGGDDEEDILQDTAQGQDETRGFSDLELG